MAKRLALADVLDMERTPDTGVQVIEGAKTKRKRKTAAERKAVLTEEARIELGNMLAKALKRVERCGQEAQRAKRALMRARMNYGVLKRLNDAQNGKDLQT